MHENNVFIFKYYIKLGYLTYTKTLIPIINLTYLDTNKKFFFNKLDKYFLTVLYQNVIKASELIH